MGERPNSRRCSSDVSDRRYRRRSAACHPRCSRHRSRSARRSHRSARSRSSRWRSPSSSEVSSCSDIAGRSHSRRRRGAHASAARSSRGASRASAVQDPNPPIAPVEPPGPSTTGVPDPSASSFTGGLHVPGPSLGHPAERVTPFIRASVAPSPWTGYAKFWQSINRKSTCARKAWPTATGLHRLAIRWMRWLKRSSDEDVLVTQMLEWGYDRTRSHAKKQRIVWELAYEIWLQTGVKHRRLAIIKKWSDMKRRRPRFIKRIWDKKCPEVPIPSIWRRPSAEAVKVVEVEEEEEEEAGPSQPIEPPTPAVGEVKVVEVESAGPSSTTPSQDSEEEEAITSPCQEGKMCI
ncbi:uncharacterized protein LOC122926205 [Bufo gargarizans]|uniref:uncharacterized protein LOC122926205 n=1 Tax=Bufo gargarizans TaxID=30331 RepID=UPI001CF17A6F|nr:uncharacterized protein LOC122926205 [Bufo gargarizans]